MIRDDHSKIVRPISPGRIHDVVHHPYIQAGLLQPIPKTRHELRVHGIRKYFRTQLASLGVNNDYIDYMMGHVVDTYHDIQMKGVEFLRGIYSASGLGIQPKTQLSRIEMAKQVLAAVAGVSPEQILIGDAQVHPHRSYATAADRDEHQASVLMNATREAVKHGMT